MAECLPVRTAAREGPQIELQQYERVKMAPSLESRSMLGVGAMSLSGPPYAEIAFSAWSSEKRNTIFGRSAATAPKVIPTRNSIARIA